MHHFQKYNLTRPSSYETFVYYDEVDIDGSVYYIQFMHAGYKDAEVMSQTFHTNLTENDDDHSYPAYKKLYIRLCDCVKNEMQVSSYIFTAIMLQIKNVGKRLE